MWQLSKDTQEAQVLLGRALENNIPGWTGNEKGADAFAMAQGRLGFESNDVRDALAQLVGVTHDLTEAQGLVSLAEDLARSKGIDLAKATDIVTKAHEGNRKGLVLLGIDVGDATTAAQLLNAVQKNVTQTAKEWAETSEGKAARAQVKLTEAMTKVGDVIDNVAQVVIPAASDAVIFLMDHFNDLVPAIGAAATGITILLVPSLVEMAAAATLAMAPLLPVIVLLGALAAANELASQKIGDTGMSLNEYVASLTGVGTSTEDATSVISTSVDDMSHSVVGGFEGMHQGAVNSWTATHDEVVTIAKKLPGDIAKAIRDGRDVVKQAIDQQGIDAKTGWTLTAQNARDWGYLHSKAYADGMKSGDPLIVASTQAAGKAVLNELGSQVVSFKTYGLNAGQAWFDGLIVSLTSGANHRTLTGAISKLSGPLEGHSPPKEGPLKDIDKWGLNIGKAWLSGLNKGMGSGVQVPGVSSIGSGGSLNASGAVGGRGGDIHVHVDRGAFIDGVGIDLLANAMAMRLRTAG